MATAALGSKTLGHEATAARRGLSEAARSRATSKSTGVQLTKVGVWFVVGIVVVIAAALNTGNNGLFLTVAALGASLVVAHVLSWWNLAHLRVAVSADREIYANSLSSLEVLLLNVSRWAPSWLIVTAVTPTSLDPPERRNRKSTPWLVPFLPGGEEAAGHLGLMLGRRGPRRLRFVSVTSLFPLGLFRKGRRYETEIDIVVFPEIYPVSLSRYTESGPGGDRSIRRVGLGHELHTLRTYQPGDDPRDVHWKQSARQQSLIVQRRQSEKLQRLRIVFDNAVGRLETDAEVKSFERLVSEAASAAVEALERGYDVALLTRDVWLDHAAGERQRRNILEALARVEPLPLDPAPLIGEDEKGLHLRLGGAHGGHDGDDGGAP